MIGNFTFCNPTKLYFGKGSVEALRKELPKYGKTVQLIYGGGSVKRNGIYDEVVALLRDCGKTVIEDGGVMPNPTVEKLREGVDVARAHKVDLLLAVGGGSCIDYAKAVAASVHCKGDPWEVYYERFEEPTCPVLPVGCVLTMVGTGSEMNGGAVITNPAKKRKIGHVFGEELYPRFAILDPLYTLTLPRNQMVAGIYDAFNHVCEQYFSGTDDNVSDYLSEGLMRAIVAASRAALVDPNDYEARSNLMWAATWALNTLLAKGKTEDWEVHMLGQAVGAYTDATHGMTLSAVSSAYYRSILPYGVPKFKRFAEAVWGVSAEGKTDEQVALAGLDALDGWMRELGVARDLRSLGVTEAMIEGIADATLVMDGGYRVLDRAAIVSILHDAL